MPNGIRHIVIGSKIYSRQVAANFETTFVWPEMGLGELLEDHRVVESRRGDWIEY